MILSNGRSMSIAPQALAETAPMLTNGYFPAKQGFELETSFALYAQLYKSQPWVATVVNKIANLIARLGINVWDVTDTAKTIDEKSPYARLIANPCPTMSPYAFWLWLAATIEIYGEAFLVKVRSGNKVTGLLPMHPSKVQIARNSNGDLQYTFLGAPNEVIDEKHVIAFSSYNPDGAMRGWSRLEPLRSTLMNEDSARRATSAWWKNMGRPGFILSTEQKLTADAKLRLKESFDSIHAGSSNAGGTAVFSDGVKPTPVQLTAEEMQYIESRKLNREEVCAVYDIPPSAVHILDNATYSNITEQMRSVYRDSMAPRIEFIESALHFGLADEFNGDKRPKFAVAEVLRGDWETRAQSANMLVTSGIMKPSEARPLFDLDAAGPEADVLYANSALQPLGAQSDQGTSSTHVPALEPGTPSIEVPIPTDDPSPQAQKFIRDLAGYIGRGTSLQTAAKSLIAAYPHDVDAIAEACGHIIERKSR